MAKDEGRTARSLPPDEKVQSRIAEWRRLWMLIALLVVTLAATTHFLAIVQHPYYQVHSDDIIWMYRFKHAPAPVDPANEYDYIHGIDQGALERWVFHVLLGVTDKMPEEPLPPEWDYTRDQQWNVQAGRVAPPEAARFVRAVNAVFLIAAAMLIYVSLVRAASPLAGLVGGLYFASHPATIEVLWSLGSDPLLWMLMAVVLLLWTYLGVSLRSAIIIGIVAGLAASAKLNGAAVVAAYCLWLVFKRRWRLALAAGGAAVVVFLITNPILFSKGVFGVPWVLADIVARRSRQAAGIAMHYPAYAEASKLRVFFLLLGPWWPLLALVLASRRLWRLEPGVFWAAALAILHCLTVTAPEARYLFPIQTGLVIGAIAGYWPRRAAGPLRLLRRLAGKLGKGPKDPS